VRGGAADAGSEIAGTPTTHHTTLPVRRILPEGGGCNTVPGRPCIYMGRPGTYGLSYREGGWVVCLQIVMEEGTVGQVSNHARKM
jgi:hypothetical protein